MIFSERLKALMDELKISQGNDDVMAAIIGGMMGAARAAAEDGKI